MAAPEAKSRRATRAQGPVEATHRAQGASTELMTASDHTKRPPSPRPKLATAASTTAATMATGANTQEVRSTISCAAASSVSA